MIQLDARQQAFLLHRRKLIRIWPAIGGGLMAALLVFSGWLYVRSPLLIDPTEIVRRLQGDGVDPSTLMALAGLVPLLFLGCIILLFLLVVFTFAKFRVERKYLAMLGECEG